MFVDLLLEPVQHHSRGCWWICCRIEPTLRHLSEPSSSSGSCLEAVQRAASDADPAAVLPLGRQHSLLNVLDVVIHKLGHLIHAHLPKVLQVLLCVTASVSAVLDNREQVTCPSALLLQTCVLGKVTPPS